MPTLGSDPRPTGDMSMIVEYLRYAVEPERADASEQQPLEV